MPAVTATSARGVVAIVLEAAGGEQTLLAPTAVSSTITGLSAPSGSTGMRLHIKLVAWTTSGTLTINGTGSPNNSETVNVPAPTTQQTQSAQLASWEYVSTNAYTALTNITTTGSFGGLITVFGIQAGKYQLPSVMKSNRKPKVYSPNEHNSFIERDKKILHLTNETAIEEVKQDIYGDISLWWPYMLLGAPVTTASIPATPTSLFAATALSATQNLTTQPTSPGMKLIITITSFTVAGTLTINGTYYGVTTSETMSIGAAGTYYSSNVYSAVSSITNATTAATMAVTGVFGWSLTFNSSGTQYSAAIEWFDGVGSWTHPFSFATDGSFDIKVQTEATLTMKGKAQDKLPIGDRSTTALAGVNRITSLGTNLADLPIVGWQTNLYLDAITGTPLTTLYNGIVQELKVDLKVPNTEEFTFSNSQNFSRVYAGKRECTADLSLLFLDYSQWEQFRQNLKQYLAVQFLGQYIGTTGGTNYSKSWTWTLPIRSDGTFDVTSDPSKPPVTAKAQFRSEYDSGIAAGYQLVVITQMPPVYAV